MKMKHAAPEEIVAFRDRELDDPEVERHIRGCPLCRRQLGEARYVRTHICSEMLAASGPTPGRDEIAAYLDEALDEKEMARVEIHIRGDDGCLAVFDTLLSATMALDDPVPSAAHVARLKRSLREPRLAGKLRVFITDRFKQVFHPVKTGQRAFGRELKMKLDPDKPLPCRDATVMACMEAPGETSPAAPRCHHRYEPSKPRLIDSGDWIIRAVSSGRPGRAFIELTIEDADGGTPVPDVPVKLDPEWEETTTAVTDEQGVVRLPLPDGESRLEVGAGPDLLVEIHADIEEAQEDQE